MHMRLNMRVLTFLRGGGEQHPLLMHPSLISRLSIRAWYTMRQISYPGMGVVMQLNIY